jgi:nicotinamide mononucleotide adenylyltransferase
MFLRELFEGPGKEASFALGRMNPAHRGHGLLVEAIKQGPGDAFIFNRSSC